MDTVPEIQAAIRGRVRKAFHREVVFSSSTIPHVGIFALVKTERGEFQWGAGSSGSELLAWERVLAAIPSEVRVFCRGCCQ